MPPGVHSSLGVGVVEVRRERHRRRCEVGQLRPTGDLGERDPPVHALGRSGGSYFGVEAEAGTLGFEGSNYAAGYGIAGLEYALPRGSLGVELAGGRRWLRASLESEDVRDWTAEGRLRARFWMSEKTAFGAALGADARGESWMAGIYLSVYSNIFNRWGQE